jgi:carbon-monoxide dehydrogenase large subunit
MQDHSSSPSLENAIALQKYGVGQPVRRKEDDTLVRGKGKYTDDFNLPGQAYAWIVRSSHAHGIIRGIDTKAAKAMPGVLGVYAAKDLAPANYGPFTCGLPLKSRDGTPLLQTNRTALVSDKVRFVGDPSPSWSRAAQARDTGSGRTRHRTAPRRPNAARRASCSIHIQQRCARLSLGDSAKSMRHSPCAHVTKLDIVNTRVAVVSMEPRVALAAFDKAAERFTLQVPTQGVSGNKVTLAKILNVANDKVRILTANVGGSFGEERGCPEYTCILHAARGSDGEMDR